MSIVLITLMVSSVVLFGTVNFSTAQTESAWYAGTNQSTSLANVTYQELYSSAGGNQSCLTRTVWINYNDNTSASVGLTIRYFFNPGGLDISNQQVLNWSDLTYSDLGINTWQNVNETSLGTIYFFKGFDIIKGTAQNFTLSQIYNNNAQNPPGSYSYYDNNVVGDISYLNYSTVQISAVTLSTVNATYEGTAMTDSVATFNVTFVAQISNVPLAGTLVGTSQNQTIMNVPVVFMFQITHDVAHTQYKYGVDIALSAAKAFPNWGSLQSGDSYSLVADDYLQFLYNNTTSQSYFSSDANNDSAIYLVNSTELCREIFPLNYTISGDPLLYNTTRIYVPDGNYIPATANTSMIEESKIFVCFSGFIYNQSKGFMFDPAIINPCSVSTTTTPTSTPSPTPTAVSTQTANPTSSPTIANTNSSINPNSKSNIINYTFANTFTNTVSSRVITYDNLTIICNSNTAINGIYQKEKTKKITPIARNCVCLVVRDHDVYW